jgi:hypothetical protein
MATINAIFRNDFSDSRHWTIVDTARDPNSPPVLFDDYLDPGAATAALALYSGDGVYGQVTYQRSDGAPTVADSITDGSVVGME